MVCCNFIFHGLKFISLAMGSAESRLPPGPNPIVQDGDKIEQLAKALDVRAERQRQLADQGTWDRREQDKVEYTNNTSTNYVIKV